MPVAPVQASSQAEGAHLVLYDGVCGLCDRMVQFLLHHDRRSTFMFASLQSSTGKSVVTRFGGDAAQLTTFYVLPNYRTARGPLLAKGKAALFVASQLPWPWKLAAVLRVLPASILDAAYDVVARSRYRLFGRLDQCLMPRPEFRRRFIDE